MFKDIKKKITEAGQNAVSQTKKLAETAELNAKINKKQGNLNKELLELGKQFYLSKKNSIPKAFADQFAAINEIREDITNMKQRVSELKEKDDEVVPTESAVASEVTTEPKAEKPAKETPAKKSAPKKPEADKKPAVKVPTAKKTAPTKPVEKAAAKKPAPKKSAVNKEVTIPMFVASGRNCANCGKPLGEDETKCPKCGTHNPVK